MTRITKASTWRLLIVVILMAWGCAGRVMPPGNQAPLFDVVLLNGRVIDPESGLDGIRNVGISGATIKAITAARISGAIEIDARGLVVSPGFIDIHQHSHEPRALRAKVLDGVTAAFEMELGVRHVEQWYAALDGQSPIHYGAAVGHSPIRGAVLTGATAGLNDPPIGEGATRAATDGEITSIRDRIRDGLRNGALGVGLAPAYTPGTTPWEVIEVFRAAAEFPGASVHVHVRDTEPANHWMETAELFQAALVTGAPLHIVHANSSFGGAAPKLFGMIEAARRRGLDITTEAYPYTAAATEIQSAPYDGWQTWPEERFAQFLWPLTGERLTRESFGRYRRDGGLVIVDFSTEEKLALSLANPLTMIVSDGGIINGAAHPRIAGAFARTLGRYVRERKTLTLSEALRKMTLMPAQRLEQRAPAMRNKGRLRVGADADITVFDPATVNDRSTFLEPFLPSAGIRHVIVSGDIVVREAIMDEQRKPGRAIRGGPLP